MTTIIVTLAKVLLGALGVILTAILGWISYLGVTNVNTTDGSAQGFGAIMMPLLAIPVVLATIPFALVTLKKLQSTYGTPYFVFALIGLLLYITFCISLWMTYTMTQQEQYSMVPVIFLAVSLASIIFSTFYGVMPYFIFFNIYIFITISLAIAVSCTFLPALQIQKKHVSSQKSVTVAYGETFDPLVARVYIFPDFILEPSNTGDSIYIVSEKSTRRITGQYTLNTVYKNMFITIYEEGDTSKIKAKYPVEKRDGGITILPASQ